MRPMLRTVLPAILFALSAALTGVGCLSLAAGPALSRSGVAASGSPAALLAASRVSFAGRSHSYVVKRGDTLSKIAGAAWGNLYSLNRDVLPAGPNWLCTGQRLRLAPGGRAGRHGDCTGIPGLGVSAPAAPAAPAQQVTDPGGHYVGPSGTFQACVIARESGGNPHAVNPSSGAGGLYQFLPSTWAALGFPGLPENAPVWMQNEAFAKAFAQSGTSPWAPYDGC